MCVSRSPFEGAPRRPMPTINGTTANDTLTGTADPDNIFGLGGDDMLFGLGGDDILDGGTGTNLLHGGAGHDIYFVRGAGDIVVEAAGEGYDTVYASLNDYTLPAEIEE